MRLFTGLELPPRIAGTLAAWQASLRRDSGEAVSGVRWSPAGNLHITTKFIGEWPEARLAELTRVLESEVPRPAPVAIVLPGIGSMTNAHQGRIVYAAVGCASDVLRNLATDTDTALARALEIGAERRPYKPHVTLGRARQDSAALCAALAAFRPDALHFEAGEFCLYQSTPSAKGTVYSKLSRFPFTT